MRVLLLFCFAAAILLVLLHLPAFAQIQPATPAPTVELPFIDRDGDGINDLLQTGWGLRFLERYNKRMLIWEQLKTNIINGEKPPLPENDPGGKDRPTDDAFMHDLLRDKMNELVDSDGDGKPDTPLGQYMGDGFQSIDKNGDGMPDEISKDEMNAYMREMHQWRDDVRDRVDHGQPPFIDANGDGIPDDLPPGMGWPGRGPHKP